MKNVTAPAVSVRRIAGESCVYTLHYTHAAIAAGVALMPATDDSWACGIDYCYCPLPGNGPACPCGRSRKMPPNTLTLASAFGAITR